METDDPAEQQNLRDEYIASLPENPPSLTQDDDVFKHLARTYANKHPTMHKGYKCPRSNETFKNGITNGAAWYSVIGGMQDYNYVAHGCMELTLEISCCKYPPANQLEPLWKANKDALLELIMQAHMGVTGIIYDRITGKGIKSATLQIVGRNMNFTTTKYGEFWRILLPGSYKLQIVAKGYHSKIVPFQVLSKTTRYPQLVGLYVPMDNISLPLPTKTTRRPSFSTTPVPSTRNVSSRTTKRLPKKYIPNDTEEAPVQLKSTSLDRFNYSPSSAHFKFNHYYFIIILAILMCLNI
ncbi:hypothetical protein ILUMI_24390 [Ignelater luminosus]|uniref:Peptidase M14 domain-containing protein n=1 Tax=Ignelater luminosus TaxID=2038154 RepID=A0A8K0C6C6_IGNLU|nr:hypothetical protein ILUMI_24390 [Ignelater luminosus]